MRDRRRDEDSGSGTGGGRAVDAATGRRRSWKRRALVAAGALFLLGAAGATAAKLLLTPEKLASMVVPRVEDAVAREVRIGTVRLDLFPTPGVRLERVELANAAGFGPEPAFRADAVELELALLPLLTGAVVPDEIHLETPSFRLQVDEEGRHNFEGVAADDAAGEDGSGGSLGVSDFRVADGTVFYEDRQAGRGARFGLDGRFSASREDGGAGLASGGELRIRSLRAMIPELRDDSLRAERFDLEYEGALFPSADSLHLARLRIGLDEIRLVVSGGVWRAGHDARSGNGGRPGVGGSPPEPGGAVGEGDVLADLRVESEELPLEALRRLVPALDLGELRPRGEVRLTGSVRGRLGGDEPPSIEGELELRGVRLAHGGRDEFVSGAEGTISFTESTARTSELSGDLLGRPFRLEAEVDGFEDPSLEARLEGEGDLARLREVLPAGALEGRLEELAPRGDAEFSLRYRGPLSGDPTSRLSGTIRLRDLALDYRGEEDVIEGATANLTLRPDGVTVEELRGDLFGRPLRLSGRIEDFGDPRIQGRADGSVDLGRVLPLLPSELTEEARARGDLDFSVRASGRLGDEGLPDLRGEGTLTGFSLDYAGVENVVRDARIGLAFDGDVIRAPSFGGLVLGNRLEGSFRLTPGEPTRVEGRVSGEVDLERLDDLRRRLAERSGEPAPRDRSLSGTASVDLAFEGPADDPARLTLEGPVRLADLEYGTPALAAPLRVGSGTLRFTGAGVETGDLGLEVGRTGLRLSLTARNVLPLARLDGEAEEAPGDGPRPVLEFRIASERVYLDELLPADEKEGGPTYSEVLKAHLSGDRVEGREPGRIALDRFPLPSLPELAARGSVRIGELINPPTRMKDLRFDVRLEDRRLAVSDVRAGLYGGSFTGDVTADLGEKGDRVSSIRFDVALRRADAGAFMGRWTKLESSMTGALDVSVEGSTVFQETLLPVTERTDADGRVTVRNGSLEGMVPMQGVVRAIGASPSRLARFDSLGGPFRVRGGSLELVDWRLENSSEDVRGEMAGSIAFAGPLDLDANFSLPLSMLQGSPLMRLVGGGSGGGGGQGFLGRFLGNAAGEDQRVDVPLSVGGTMSNPSVRVHEKAFATGFQGVLRSLRGGDQEDEGGGGGLLGELGRILGGGDEEEDGGGGGGPR